MDHHHHNQRQGRKRMANDKLLIKGGKIVNHDHSFVADVYVENGIIKQIGSEQVIPGGVTIIEAHGSLVLPGGIDVATFMETKPTTLDKSGNDEIISVETFYSGSKAALAGGTTTIMDFINCERGHILTELQRRTEIAEKACCNISFHADVTTWNEKVANDMKTMVEDKGINSFRVHMSDRNQLSDAQIYDVFKHIKSLGCVAIVHAENGDLIKKNLNELKSQGHNGPETVLYARNEEVECDGVFRAITIAKQVACPIFFWNVTSQAAIDIINEAKVKGFPVYAQTLAVGLSKNGAEYKEASWEKAAAHLTFPPLRDDLKAQEDLITAVSSGSLSCVASGHAVFKSTQKATYGKADCSLIPPGTNGVFERMMCVWGTAVDAGSITENEFVAVTSTNAAKLFNIYPKKGHIAVGSDADIVIWDEKSRRNLASAANTLGLHKGDFENGFTGIESSAGPKVVICRGRVVVDNETINVVQGWGELIARPIRPPFIYKRLELKDKANKIKFAPIVRSGVPTSETSVNGTPIKFPEPAESDSDSPRFSRGSGNRSMHQSGWSFSGDQYGDEQQRKTGHKILGPPGGSSSILIG